MPQPKDKDWLNGYKNKTAIYAVFQSDLIDTNRTFHPKTMNFIIFSSAHRAFSRIGHILGHNLALVNLKKIEIIPVIFSHHNAVRLDLNYRKKKNY